jgi:hypothetical protein
MSNVYEDKTADACREHLLLPHRLPETTRSVGPSSTAARNLTENSFNLKLSGDEVNNTA